MKKLKIDLQFSGQKINEPVHEIVDVDAEVDSLKVPIEKNGIPLGIITYKLWELWRVVPAKHPDLNLDGDILIEKWISEKVIQNHPYANKLLGMSWSFYEEKLLDAETKMDKFLDE